MLAVAAFVAVALTADAADDATFYVAGGEAAGATSEGFRVDIDTGDAGLSKGDRVTWRPRVRSLAV